MQNITIKLLILLVIFDFIILSKSFGSSFLSTIQHSIPAPIKSESNIPKADSLFDQNKYTESYRIYEEIFTQSKMFTPQMLLKMAYIKEGLNDYVRALFYLNVYYLKNPDKKVLERMEYLAKKYKLKGYKITDRKVLYSLYLKYRLVFSAALIFGAFLYFAVIIYKYKLKKKIKPSYRIAFILYLVVVYYVISLSKSYPFAIIKNDSSLIMRAPAAGSELVESVEKGHKVKLIGSHDIWYKVLWKDEPDPWYKVLWNNEPDALYKIIWKKQPAYIRQNNVMLISED